MSTRLLQNGVDRLLESGGSLSLEDSLTVATPTLTQYPLSSYPWTDRFGITKPDVYGPINLLTLPISPTSTGNYGNLLVTADSPSVQTVGLAIVLWDERGNPISVSSGYLTFSGWAKTAMGNFIPSNGYGTAPGLLNVDVSMAAGYTVLVQSFSVQNLDALGTVATKSGSAAVVGTTTGFSGTLNSMVGLYVVFSGDTTATPYKIASVTDSFHLTLSAPVTWTGAGQIMTFVNPVNLHWRSF